MKAHNTETKRIMTAFCYRTRALVLSLALLVAGCGGGGGGSAPDGVASVAANSPAPQAGTAVNSYSMKSDDYGMENATFLAASKSSLGIVLRVAIASSMTDQNFKTVFRIDIPDTGSISPAVVYSLGAATGSAPAFPGNLYFLNGHQSTLLRTVGGTITFRTYGSNSGARISGSYSAVVEDGNDPSTPKVSFTIAADFDFAIDSYGPVFPAHASEALAAVPSYDAYCASCHTLGDVEQKVTSGAPDLALQGGRMNSLFTPELPSHQGIVLTAEQIRELKVLLNIN